MGLCRPANEIDQGKVFGVLPFVAPEVLQEKPYTQPSDIYSFGIVAYELFSVTPPYYDRSYNWRLSLDVCRGLRPEFKIKIPQLLEDLIKKYFFSIECKEKTTQKQVININTNQSPKTEQIINKSPYQVIKLKEILITSKQATKRANHYRVNYLDKWQNSGFFFMDSYFRDKKEVVQPNLVGDFLLLQGYKYQFFYGFG